jgi:hypothetical protein
MMVDDLVSRLKQLEDCIVVKEITEQTGCLSTVTVSKVSHHQRVVETGLAGLTRPSRRAAAARNILLSN